MEQRLGNVHRAILNAFLRAGIGQGISLRDIRNHITAEGLPGQDQAARRIRELRAFGYRIEYRPRERTYALLSADPLGSIADTEPISGRLRVQVLLAAHGRCQNCGRTIQDDHIKLVVDHRTPRAWGGRTERENLWAICEWCNVAKRDYFSTFDPDLMKRCMQYREPIRRIGELLIAFKGRPVSRQLLEAVGQDEQWTRRLRELRELGWTIHNVIDRSRRGRMKYEYQLEQEQPWPTSISAALREHRRRQSRRHEVTDDDE